MAFEIVWTPRAQKGFEEIVRYLHDNFTEREVENFLNQADDFFKVLSESPEILQQSAKLKNTRRGPINPLTKVTYRVKPRRKPIQLIDIRSTRKRPFS
ncbi:MAG: type II toxin-antitoxin system RelE/ParE family toxin [Bacteroidota bacterium]